ncbi:hypothetical protein [Nostoc sp.]|uniref:hypothetical protein n=1 Tax=Nostoc sp. TaxID=1180 RepID=UPI002FF6E464
MLNEIITVYAIIDDLLKAMRHSEAGWSFNSARAKRPATANSTRNSALFIEGASIHFFFYSPASFYLTSHLYNLKSFK